MTQTASSDNSPPYIRYGHVDGPILIMRNGGCKWLSISERIKLWFGIVTLEDLECMYWQSPDYWSGNNLGDA